MRSTFNNPIGYWLIGAILIWLVLPAHLADILIAPQWYAPNWQCDSLGIPIMQVTRALLPWVVVAVVLSAIIVVPVAWRRQAGRDIFDLRSGRLAWNCIATLVALAILVPILIGLGAFVWQAAIPQMISSDCAGRAELVEITMRGPALQASPFLWVAMGIWTLHLRALFLSPRRQ